MSPSSGVLSPLNRALTVTRSATSGSTSGVGSSEVPISPGAPLLVSDGSDPLSESSVAVIGAPVESVNGLPFSSTASPPTVTVFSIPPIACEPSTSTVNSKVNESPTVRSEAAAVSTISVLLPPFQFPVSRLTELAESAGGTVKARL